MEQKETRLQMVNKANLDDVELLVLRARKASVDPPGLQVQQDPRVLEVLLVSQVLTEPKDIRANVEEGAGVVHEETVEIQAPLELTVNREDLVLGDHVVKRANQGVPDDLELLVTLATPGKPVLKDLLALRDSKDQLDPPEYKDLGEV